MALAGAGALAAVLAGVSLIAVAGAVGAASTGEAVLGAEKVRAVGPGPGFIARADLAFTAAAPPAVVQALGLGAVLAKEALGADAGPGDAPTVGSARRGTGLGLAVLSPEAFRAFARPVNTAAPVLAVPGAVRLAAVGSPPARLTRAAAVLAAVVPVAVTVGTDGHVLCQRKTNTFSFRLTGKGKRKKENRPVTCDPQHIIWLSH